MKLMENKKALRKIILGLGAAMILVGLIVLLQSGTDHTGHGGGLTRASTSIEFGADFYTSSAQSTGLAANAVVDLYKLTSVVTGIFFIFVGGLDVCITLLLTDVQELLGKEKPAETKAADQRVTE